MLTSAPISRREAERRLQELLYEFYLLYFTGAPVEVGGDTVTFEALPKNTKELTHWLFGDAELRGTPAAWVHTVITDWRLHEQDESETQKLVRGDLTLSLCVRAANPGRGLQEPDFRSRAIADGLRQIFESEQHALAQKGIHHARVRRGPVPVAFPGTHSRMLMVTAQTHYRTSY
jgi:hypothetical protein